MSERPRAALSWRPSLDGKLISPADLAVLKGMVDLRDEVVRDLDGDVSDIEYLITGWGCPRLDADALERMPKLTHVFHAAGTVKTFADPVLWERGIVVTSAAAANAVPVVEFTIAQILLTGKAVDQVADVYRKGPDGFGWAFDVNLGIPGFDRVGNYTKVVGIISASSIGRLVLDLLKHFDYEVLLFDPFVTADEAAELGAAKVELGELFARSDIISLHTPDLPATRGMITRELLASMRDGATFINTARPLIVDQDALVDVLREGRQYAILDVVHPEPLPSGHPLWDLPNVKLTPHWAGSQGLELHRMSRMAIDAIGDVLAGRPPRGEVTAAMLATMA